MTSVVGGSVANGFGTSVEHLLAELGRIDLLVRISLLRARLGDPSAAADEFRGLYVSDAEMESVLAGSPPLFAEDPQPSVGSASLEAMEEAREQTERAIARGRAQALERGVELRLNRLSQLFDLSPLEVDALLVCVLPELNLKYERLYAYLHDDVTRKRPSVDLVLRLLCSSLEERLAARWMFSAQAPLVRYGLVHVDADAHARNGSSLVKTLKVDERTVDYLLGGDQIDARLVPFAHLVRPAVGWDEVVLPEGFKDQVRRLWDRCGDGAVCYLHGAYGVGRRTAAEALCREAGLRLLVIDGGGLLAGDVQPEAAAELALREASLQGAALYWQRFDMVVGEGGPAIEALMAKLAAWRGVAFLAGETPWVARGWHDAKPFVCIEFPLPSHGLRIRLWRAHLDGQCPSDDEVSALADKFRLSGGQIRDAAAAARSLAVAEGRGGDGVSLSDLYRACRMQSNQSLANLARKIEPRYAWDDIVLPRDQMAQLREVCNHVQYRHVVYDDWRFGRKLSVGSGLNVLFAGVSGTGKTMASEIIAAELGLDLYKIDLSGIVSKYIGETEKNLDRVFREGRDSNAILLFDEADALFGKRSEVRDSHDRYANIEVAYLLQKMEEYEGIVILATNLRKNVDEAFARRMHFSVEFPFPEEADRHQIWRRIFPPEAPLSDDVDLAFAGRQFRVTGGNIKNIAVAAGFLAAADRGTITMEHLVRGAKREYQKIGKLCTEADFAQYFELVKG